MKKKNNKTIRGFTLIELLVVITIIMILGSILLTVYGRAKFKANSLKAQSNAHQIAIGIEMYRGDHEGRCAPNVQGGSWTDQFSSQFDKSHSSWKVDPITGDPYFHGWYWGKLYESYLGGSRAKKLFHDPTCKASSSYYSDGPRGEHRYVDWSLNGIGWDFTDESGNFDGMSASKWTTGRADAHYIDPVNTILFQSGYESTLDGNGDVPCFSFRDDSRALDADDYKGGETTDNSETTLRELFRHGGKSAVIYADGHLEMNTAYDLRPHNYMPEEESLKTWIKYKYWGTVSYGSKAPSI